MYPLGMLLAERNSLTKAAEPNYGLVFLWRAGVLNRYGDSAMPSENSSSKLPFLIDLS